MRVELRIIRDQHKEDQANQAHVNLLITNYEAGVKAEQGRQAERIAALEARLPERRQGDMDVEEERRVGE
jgi:hypothetical protein